MTSAEFPTIQPGQPAPDFDLPLVGEDRRARLADYRGRADLLLVLMRSFECPFCRRNLTALKHTAKALAVEGIETLAVTTTSLDAARLYAKYRAPGLPLASDPALGVHRNYGVPIYRFSKDQPTQWPHQLNIADMPNVILRPSDDVPEAMTIAEAGGRLDADDGVVIEERPGEGPPDDVSPLVSYFMIDRGGIVRWVHVIALDDPRDYAQHPSHADLMAAATTLVG